MWPYVAGAIVALGGLWKLVAILRCRQEDVPKVASALTSMVTLRLPRRSSTANRLDLGMSVGATVGEFVIIAVVPHATLPLTWAVAARRGDSVHASWTAAAAGPGEMPVILDRTDGFCRVEDALAEMLRRARS